MPCGYTKRYTFDGDSGALASLARSAHPLGVPGDPLKTTFHPGLPGMATSPDVGTAWSRPQSDITVKPAGSFDHVPPAGGGAGAGLTVTEATGALEPTVVPLAPLERAPNTTFAFRVPRNATSWN